MDKYFNNRRFSLLCKNEVVSNYKSWGIYFVTIIGVYLFFSFISVATNRYTPYGYDPNSMNYMFPGFLFLGGYIVSSLTFSDINDKFKSSLWFSLPGSTLEKYLVGVLISSIGYALFLITAFVIASIFSKTVTTLIFGTGVAVFNPFTLGVGPDVEGTEYMFIIILSYMLTNALFIVGSIVFQSAAFIKTILAGFIIQSIFSIFFFIIFSITVKLGVIEQWDIRIFESIVKYFEYHTDPKSLTSFILKVTLIPGVIFSLFFNVVGYFKLAEKEVKGGI